MGATLANPNLEWCEKKDLKMMDDRVDQWIAICVMSRSEDESSIDAIIEDVTDLQSFEGLTDDDDLFDEASLTPLSFDGMTAIKTKMSLHRACYTWNDVASQIQNKSNCLAVCPIAVYTNEHFDQAKILLKRRPANLKCLPVLVRNARSDDAELD